MKRSGVIVAGVALLGLAISFIGSNMVSATPADAALWQGCFVKEEFGQDFDPNCSATRIMKYGDDGELQFFIYRDHGQSSWRPETPYRATYELCPNFGNPLGIICGIASESVMPSGEYRSTFMIR